MNITLNHTIVPSHNHIESAKFYEIIFGFEFVKKWGSFAVVKVNDTLTLDFMNQDTFTSNHYAFKVSETQFDKIFNRLKNKEVIFGSGLQRLKTVKSTITMVVEDFILKTMMVIF